MSDYRVRVSVRNARLLRAIEQAGHRPGPQFANAVGISYSGALLPYLNLTRSPLTPDGLLRECAWALCDFLQASPSDLWSDAQLQPLQQNYSSVDLDADSVHSLSSWLALNPYPIWGNGSDFDNAQLQNAFNQLGLRWPYHRNRCLRSLKGLVLDMYPDIQLPEFPAGKIKHHALHDAEHEADVLATLINVLGAHKEAA